MPEALTQPQGDFQLNPESPFAMAAHALISGASDLNLANGTFLDRSGTFEVLLTPVGKAHSFRKNGWLVAQPEITIGTQPFAEFWYGYTSDIEGVNGTNNGSGSDTGQPTFLTGSTNNTTAIFSRAGSNSGSIAENWGSYYRFQDLIASSAPIPKKQLVMLMSVYTEQGVYLLVDGVVTAYADTGYTALDRGTGAFMLGSFVRENFWTSTSDVVLSGRAIMSAPLSYWEYLGRNPHSVFAAPYVEDDPEAAAVATLAGSATAQATASGAVTTSICLSGAATAGATAAGTLSTAIRMTGSTAAQASIAGTLATQIKLAGTVTATATASGALTTQVGLAGVASARASTIASLSTGIVLTGAAVAGANASGTLAGGAAQLSGAAVASASAAGVLTTNLRLAGAASAQATAAGSLGAAGVILSGAAVASAGVSGALLTTIRMSGLAAASASATGALAPSGQRPIDASKIAAARRVAFGGGSRTVVFGGGTRVVVFGGGTRVVVFDVPSIEKANTMANADKPYFKDGKWWVDKDPDEKSYYVADVTKELADRGTTATSVEILVGGVSKVEGPSIQGGLIVVQLEGMDKSDNAENFWTARVTCANTERFDRTTWLNRVDN